MAFMVLNFEVDDFDTWKQGFDADPAGRGQSGATSYTVSRNVDDPNEVFIRVDYPSVEQAKAFRERLLASGAIESSGMRMKSGPSVAEVADQHTY